MTRRLLVCLTLAIAALTCFSLSLFCYGLDDDQCYRFIFDADEFENLQTIQPLTSLSELIDSQTYHYLHVNGRAPAHVLVQIFMCLLPPAVFAAANSCVFVAFVVLLAAVCFPRSQRHNPWSWLCLTILAFYGFPGAFRRWFEVAFSLNYLWVGCLTLAFLLVFQRLGAKRQVKPLALIVMTIGAFLCGWSQEAFALPLSAAVFLYYLFVEKAMPGGTRAAITLALWLGTCLLVFSPAVFQRIEYKTQSTSQVFISLYECYASIWIFWALLIIDLLLISFKRLSIRQLFSARPILCLMLIIAVPMSVVAHTMSHSLTAIELVSLILLIESLRMSRIRIPEIPAHIQHIAYVVVLVGLTLHLGAIVNQSALNDEQLNRMAREFVESPDGVIHQIEPHGHLAAYYDQPLEPGPETMNSNAIEFAATCGIRDKLPFSLSEADFRRIIESPDTFFVEKNRIGGNAGLYVGEKYYFAPVDSNYEAPRILAHFDDDSFMQTLPPVRRAVYRLFLHGKKAPKELKAFTADTRRGRYLVACKILSTPTAITAE